MLTTLNPRFRARTSAYGSIERQSLAPPCVISMPERRPSAETCDLGAVHGLVDHRADIPFHAGDIEAKYVLVLPDLDVGLGEYPIGDLDELVAGIALRRLPRSVRHD